MKRKISAVEARKKFGEILEGVYYRGDEVLIERAGKPMAAVIPLEQYEAMERARDRLIDLVESNWEANKDIPPEKIEEAITRAIRQVRGREEPGPRGN